MSQLFGFQINRKEGRKGQSPVPPNAEESIAVAAGGYYGTYVDTDNQARNEYEMIRRYRDMALHPEVDSAVDEVVNEFVVSDAHDTPVEINLDNLDAGMGIKKKIRDEFEYIKRLLNFDNRAHEIVRSWYIDGRLYYHKVIDLENPKKGITELRYIDPMKIKKVRQKIDQKKNLDSLQRQAMKGTALEYEYGTFVDYYLYNPKGFYKGGVLGPVGDMSLSQGVKMAIDSITFCPSGLQDLNKRMTLGFLHKAIKALNQLRMIEDSLVIYRLSRAPERRIFYIDVGNLPKVKAEQYLRDVMARYRNKLVYDASTGEMRDDKKHMSMLEDFWLPRREGGRGTEITTLPGGQNLGELEDVKYFQKKLYKALNVPNSRLETETTFNIGRAAEITRDEVKFQKFVARLRKRFGELFVDLLKTQLILKGIISIEEWEDMKEHIQFDYIADNYFSELKDIEIRNERINQVAAMDPYVGKYFSIEYMRRQVIKQTDQEIIEIDEQIEQEIADGKLMDPAEQAALDAGIDPMAAAAGPEGMEEPATAGKPEGPSSADQKRAEF